MSTYGELEQYTKKEKEYRAGDMEGTVFCRVGVGLNGKPNTDSAKDCNG
jgi:hypothetical protein